MYENPRETLLEAVNALVQAEDGPELLRAIQELTQIAPKLGVRFTGERAVLNPLVDLALNDPPKFLKVLELVESKRHLAGLAPLNAREEGGYNKTDYMREFMAQKRERERRAVEVENLMRPPSAQLRGRARLDFQQAQSAKWKEQRDAMLEAVKNRVGRKLRRDEEKDVITQFWARVDSELDDLETMARAERSGTLRRV